MKKIKLNLNLSFQNIIEELIKTDPLIGKYYSNTYPNTKYKLSDIINDILYILKTGISWRNIKSHINSNTLYWHYNRFIERNIFGKLYKKFKYIYMKKYTKNINIYSIDTSFIQNKFGKSKIERNKYFKNKKCMKLSMIVDLNGVPLSAIVNKGNIHDLKFTELHLNDLILINKYNKNHKYMLADKAYESKKFRNSYSNRNFGVMISPKTNLKKKYYYDKQIYKKRSIVENVYARLKQMRRIEMRYDSKLKTYFGFLYLAMAVITYKFINY